jgi:hypothetical protein
MGSIAKVLSCAHEWFSSTGGNWDAIRPGHVQHLKRVFADLLKTGISINASNAEDFDLRVARRVENGKSVINAGVNIKNYVYGQFFCLPFSSFLEAYRLSSVGVSNAGLRRTTVANSTFASVSF